MLSPPGDSCTSNTYVTEVEGCGGPTTAGSGVCGFIALTTTSTSLAIGSTITITLSAASGRIAGVAQFFTGASSVVRSKYSAGTSDTTTTTATVTAASVNSGDIVFGSAAVEDGSNTLTADADTTNGTWSACTTAATSNGAGLTEVMVTTQHKVTSAAGSQTFDIGTTNTDNFAMAVVLRRLATPAEVTSLSATPGNGQMGLSWTAAADNDAPITDYIIEVSSNGGGSWSTFADGTSSSASATVTGLTNGTLYTFRVTAVNSVGNGEVTATTTGTPRTVPDAPTGLAVSSNGNGTTAVSWTAPAFNGGSAITGYVVTDSTDTVRCTTSNTSCNANGLAVGQSHRLKVHAVNVAGAGAPTSLSAPVLQLGPPADPASVKIVSGRYRFLLSWTAPDNRGFEILQYQATVSFGGDTYTCTTSATRCSISALPSTKRTYRVVVTATNVHATSGESPEVLFATWYTPAPPSNVDLTDFQFSGLDLSHTNLSGSDLSGVGFGSANLTGAMLKNVNLTGTDLSGATLTGLISVGVTGSPTLPAGYVLRNGFILGPNVNMYGQDLSGVDMSGLNLAGVQFGFANLTSADLDSANLTGAILRSTDLTGASLVSANLTRAAVLASDLDSANLSSANLSRSNLTGSSVSGTTFTSATLTGARSGSMTGSPAAVPAGWVFGNGHLVGPRAYLVSANLSNLDLTGIDLSATPLGSANLSGATLTSANLSNSNLDAANLDGATFTSANLTNTSLVDSSTAGTVFTGSTLNGVRSMRVTGNPHLPTGWTKANGHLVGPGANLAGADLKNHNFSGVNLTGAILTGADATNANFSSVNFTRARFTNANLTGANFSNANLSSAVLTGATMTNATLTGATLTGLRSGSVTGSPTLPANWSTVSGFLVGPGVFLANANLTAANLSNATFSSTNLAGANLAGAILTGANLTGATLAGLRSGSVTGSPTLPTNWSTVSGFLVGPGANLFGANLSGANLSGLSLTSANFSTANLSSANLSGATLTSSNFSGANLTNAVLTGAGVSRAQFRNSTFTGATAGSLVGVPSSLPTGFIFSGAAISPA